MRTILATAAAVVALAFHLHAGDTSKETVAKPHHPAPAGLRDGMSLSLEAMTAVRHRWPTAAPTPPKAPKELVRREERPVDVEELRQAVAEFLKSGRSAGLAWHPEMQLDVPGAAMASVTSR
jgi:hypothetical protein